MIHAYSDPAGLRRPELGATGVERREEQPFGVMMEIGSNEREREGAALGREQSELCLEGVPPPPLFIRGGGREPPLEEGAALGLCPRVSSSLGLRQGGGGSFLEAPPSALPSWATFGPSAPSHLGLPNDREPIHILFIKLIPKPFEIHNK